MDLALYLQQKGDLVEKALLGILGSYHTIPPVLRDSMQYTLLSPGKRIRPALAIATCEALGGDPEQVLPFACAIEMIHTYSLIHDDLPALDNDDTRRGRPTCHKAFGEPMAILAGDALLTEAFMVMSDPGRVGAIEPGRVIRIIQETAKAAGAEGMVGGQVMDILYDGKKGTKRILQYIHTNKTTAMIRLSVRTGAMIAGAGTRELKHLTRYGECIGFAFQIMDDLLDVLGDEEKVGKRLRKDVTKQTYVKHYGVEASKKRIEELTSEAVHSLEFLGGKASVLIELARFIGNRVF